MLLNPDIAARSRAALRNCSRLSNYLGVCVSTVERRKARCRGARDEERPGARRVRIGFRPYQLPVFLDRSTGVLVLHWSRQIGKSFTLAAWAVDRLLTRPGRLVTVLSNSRENGSEFVAKCAQVCKMNGTAYKTVDKSRGIRFQNMRMEVRIWVNGKMGRIKVLAANPRTARGFSGDLILDEFAFHEDSQAIWDAAEPILASNADYLCRVASTGNGRHNLFYRMTAGIKELTTDGHGWTRMGGGVEQQSNEGTKGNNELGKDLTAKNAESAEEGDKWLGVLTGTGFGRSAAGFVVSRVSRTQAHEMGTAVYDTQTREEIAPEVARSRSLDKRSYDQNYECSFADENTTLLTHELINAAEQENAGVVCEQDWKPGVVDWLGGKETNAESPNANDEKSLWWSEKDPDGFEPEEWRTTYVQEGGLFGTLKKVRVRVENPTGKIRYFGIGKAWQDSAGNANEAGSGSDVGGMGELKGLPRIHGNLYAGLDVGRNADISVLTVVEALGDVTHVRAILRMEGMRLPEQQSRLGELFQLQKFKRVAIDMTGLGLGLFEYAEKEFGRYKVQGVNFGSSVPATNTVASEGRRQPNVRVTEAMAMELLRTYEERRIRQPMDGRLREDLRKPEKITTPGGRVSIAATRDSAGHADHFWSLALALEAAATGATSGGCGIELIPRPFRPLPF